MRNLLISTATILVVTAASSVSAQGMGQSLYGSAFLGYGVGDTIAEVTDGTDFVEYTFDGEGGALFGITVGATVAPNIRAEAEISYIGQSIETIGFNSAAGDSSEIDVSDEDLVVSNTYYMANIWYDIAGVAPGAGITPYVGGGLGLATIRVETNAPDDDGFDDGTGFAFQVGAGVQIPVGSGAVDLGYRYKSAADVTIVEGFSGGPFDLVADSAVNTVQAAYVLKF